MDDHAVVRKGLRALLDRESGIEVIGEAEDGEEAVRATDRLRPDVILMDLEMPGLGGIEATRRIAEVHAATKVVVLTSHASEEDVFLALKSGALGYLLKHSAPEDVLQAIRQAYRGETASGDRTNGPAGASPCASPEAGDHRSSLRTRARGVATHCSRHE